MIPLSDIPVLILVGGKGTRLASLVSDVPKPMAPIGEKPFLHYILTYLKQSGFIKITLLTGYKSESISDYFGDGKAMGLQISYSHEATPLGTGGATRQAMKQIPAENFLILNGDTFYNIDYKAFVLTSQSPVSMALNQLSSAGRYGTVVLNHEGQVTAFKEKAPDRVEGFINAGVYLLNKEIADLIPSGFVSLETDVFPELASKGWIQGVPMKAQFIDIGIPEDYKRAQTEIPRWISNAQVGSI